MNAKVEQYIENPDPKLWRQLTSEQQRFVERTGKVKSQSKAKRAKKSKKVDDEPKSNGSN